MDSLWRRRQALGVMSALTLGAGGLLAPELVRATKSPSLYVFVPTLVRARALSQMLQAQMVGVAVTVFARFAEFMSAIATHRPDAALSLATGLEAVGLKPVVQGRGPSGDSEAYVVVTADQSVDVESLSTRIVGAVEIVGRRALPTLVRKLLGLNAVPNVRRVLRVADLLPLLSLELADGILVAERFLADTQAASRLTLGVLRPPGARLRRAAVAYPKGRPNALVQARLESLSPSINAVLGVERWGEVQ